MKNILLMNMSGVCLNQEMFGANVKTPDSVRLSKFTDSVEIIECREISGTDCYCDDMAEEKLKELIENYSPNGLHYIDSGNYHYLSKLWTDKIDKEFDLVVFDHHPDMQSPLFGPILSCGSWIKDTIEANSNLKNVYVIGVNEELITQDMQCYDLRDCENTVISGCKNVIIKDCGDAVIKDCGSTAIKSCESTVSAKVHFITKQMLAEKRKISGRLNIEEFIKSIIDMEDIYADNIVSDVADIAEISADNDIADIVAEKQTSGDNRRKRDIYISIDKDVLSENEYKTNWDQGDMSVEELLDILKLICSIRNVIGIDVCGEMDVVCAQKNPKWNITNNIVNNRLMHFINYLEKN